MKDKILSSGIATEFKVGNDSNATIDSAVKDEAVGALTMLGFSPAPSAKVVSEILKNEPTLPVEQVVKLALKQIK